MMQLFNEINSRKLHNEWNVLTGVLNNHLFVGIWLLTFGLQILMVQFGSLALSCHYEVRLTSFVFWLVTALLI